MFLVGSSGYRFVDKFWYFQDLTKKPKYLVTFTVGLDQKYNIDAAVKKVTAIKQFILLL